ncbi:MAG: transglycosylase SLT domain-containing protein [Candidatus Tectomicrobia bacterium]|nr:transglycosylase SLT domain-containing protein [Candidatus Tectomicrobia bacterium]
MSRQSPASFCGLLLMVMTAWLSGPLLTTTQAQQNSTLPKGMPTEQVLEGLTKRLDELFAQMQQLRGENERLRAQVDFIAAQKQKPTAKQAAPGPLLPGHLISAVHLPEKVTFAGEPVPLDRWDVRERLEREFFTFLGEPAKVLLLMKRSGRFFPYLEAQLRKHSLPDDLKYLAAVESWLNTSAYSHAGASGVWQFIKSTGRRYGMRYDTWVDDRRDLEKSTRAAMRYLSELQARFSNWPLVMAAYNAGESRVSRELGEQRVTSYYQLDLPLETERYVFKIIAIKLIFEYGRELGFQLARNDFYEPYDTEPVQVKIQKQRVHLSEVAKAAKTYFRQLKRLNPSFRRDSLPRGTYRLHIPKGHAADFARTFAAAQGVKPEVLAGHRVDPEPQRLLHEVRPGETLWAIADRYDVTVPLLRQWNDLAKKPPIFPGDDIVILTR